MSKAIRDYPELLMPAGDMEKLKTAIRFGADAVYLGTSAFGLRAHAGNFSIEQLREARTLTRPAGVALYLTLNASLAAGGTGWPRRAAGRVASPGAGCLYHCRSRSVAERTEG